MISSGTSGATPNGKLNGIVTSINSPIAPHSTLDPVAAAIRLQEREKLRNIITQWNANRYDMFEISEPNEDLEFYGVMRFFFQDVGQKVATKCMRISSTARTNDVIKNLIEKFRPDIRMLSVPEYALYEIHENGEERKLDGEQMPLLVQLNWHKDDREGRFLLRRMDEKTGELPSLNLLNRKLSKREQKEKKKREKKEKAAKVDNKSKDSLAEKLYTELPETSFTRSISNPEAVMRRRRQQKLEKKLQQFSQEGGPEAGGTLRIFGESINQDVPYKTILLSTRDTAAYAVKEILEKYGKEKENPSQYCLVQVVVPYMNGDVTGNGGPSKPLAEMNNQPAGNIIREYILEDDDCPLIIERSHVKTRGVLTFHIRRRPPDFQPRKRKKKLGQSIENDAMSRGEEMTNGAPVAPYLIEVNVDGSEINRPGYVARRHFLYTSVVEVGSEVGGQVTGKSPVGTIQLFGPNVQARHCILTNSDGIITVAPCSRDAETFINGTRISDTTVLKPGMLVRFGKLHTFKFVDEMLLRRHSQLSAGPMVGQHGSFLSSDQSSSVPASASFETTFNPDGKVETATRLETSSINSGSLQRYHTMGSLPRSASTNSNQTHGSTTQPVVRKGDNILPAILEVWDEIEDKFLSAIINHIEPNQVHFKLCITYALYMVTRYRASTYFKPEITPEVRANRLITFCIRFAHMIQQTIEEHQQNQPQLAFWLANSSELLHFLKNDRHLSAFTFDSQDILAEAVQLSFTYLVVCEQSELKESLATFGDDMTNTSDGAINLMTSKVLNVLSNSMQLLRRFRVNAALTIQLFSQLFHYINMWLFNKVIGNEDINFCSRLYGNRLKHCLVQIELWAEKQGLELAAECHLSRIMQTAHFLQAPKKSTEELSTLIATFYKLNSLQLQTLCEQYKSGEEEIIFTPKMIESLVATARTTTDELILKEGREIRLEEESDLQLPFLLPEDGYSCDIVRGIPAGLQDFIQKLVQARLCSLTIQPTASGYWTIYFINFQPEAMSAIQENMVFDESMKSQDESSPVPKRASSAADNPPNHPQLSPNKLSNQLAGGKPIQGAVPPKQPMVPGVVPFPPYSPLRNLPEPEIQVLKLQKSNNGIGLSIVAARGNNQPQQGIYIKSVVRGGAADLDGRLEAGDQLLKVDGHSLIGISQERAAELMTQTGPVVTLEVAKQGALFHGLLGILNQQQAASANLINKNLGTLRPRFAPNSTDYGAPRMNGHHHMNPIHSQYAPPQPRLPGYNTMPLTMAYNHQMAASFRNPIPSNGSFTYGNTNPMRPDSQLSFNSQTNSTLSASQLHPEERHYQNIQLYQLTPTKSSSSGCSSQIPSMPTSMSKLSPNISLHQNLISTANASMPMLHGSHSSLQQSSNSSIESSLSNSSTARPVSAIITSRDQEQMLTSQYPSSYPSETHPYDAQRREKMIQEAKMEEIREELRRREDRLQYSMGSLPRGVSLSNSTINPMIIPPGGGLVRPARFTSQQTLNTGVNNGFKPQVTASQLRNGPPPPAPKPNRSMGSISNQLPPPNVSYRYGLSGYPSSKPSSSGVVSPSPWEREEKEREVQQKIEETRRSRMDEINYLESLPYRNPKNEERLRKLVLEREFQKRADEHAEDDEEEDSEMLERAENRERMLSMKQDIERTRQRRIEQRYGAEYVPDPKFNKSLEEQEERLKILRLEEEAAQQAEELLLMEAKRRQNDEGSDACKSILKVATGSPESDAPPPLPNSPPPFESANQRLDRLLLSTVPKHNEFPDEMGLSSTPPRTGVLKNSNAPDMLPSDKSTKKVSWNDNPSVLQDSTEQESDQDEEREEEEEEPQEDRFSLQDIDDVLGAQGGSGKDWLNNYVSGNTPGVIGAQEVYNDPRKRIEAERNKSNQSQVLSDKLPEKLSFQEKMKMFAKTTGGLDNNPVRNKVKTSKAQREIEGDEGDEQ